MKRIVPILLGLLCASAQAMEPAELLGDYWAALGYERSSYALIIDRIDDASETRFKASGRFGIACKGLTPVTLAGQRTGDTWRVGFDYQDRGRGEFSVAADKQIKGEWIGPHGKGRLNLLRGGVYATCPELQASDTGK